MDYSNELKTFEPARKVLSPSEQLELIQFSATSASKTVFKLCHIIADKAKDEAVETDPANRDAQTAAITVAHAINRFVHEFENYIDFAAKEHLAGTKMLALNRELKEQGTIEEIIMSQTEMRPANLASR